MIFRFSKIVVLLALLMVVTACGEENKQLHQQRLFVFGTNLDISIYGVNKEKAQLAFEKLSGDFRDMHRSWHAWKPSDLTALNAAIKAGKPHKAAPSLKPLLPIAMRLYRDSDGLFNPAIGGLIGLWGFHSSDRPNGPPPALQAINKWLASSPNMDDLEFKNGLVISRNPDVQLDLGGFAKGYGVDLAMETLKSMKITNAIINAGGDLRAIGTKGDTPWRIGVRHPQGKGVLASMETRGDESVYTSGNYVRYREHEGVRYAHILDGRTGKPVEGITSATVIHDDGSIADATATALVVAGADNWYQIARKMGIKYAMLVDDKGTIYMNPRMRDRVSFETPLPTDIRVSAPL